MSWLSANTMECSRSVVWEYDFRPTTRIDLWVKEFGVGFAERLLCDLGSHPELALKVRARRVVVCV